MTKATGQDYASGGSQDYANGEDKLPSSGKGKQNKKNEFFTVRGRKERI